MAGPVCISSFCARTKSFQSAGSIGLPEPKLIGTSVSTFSLRAASSFVSSAPAVAIAKNPPIVRNTSAAAVRKMPGRRRLIGEHSHDERENSMALLLCAAAQSILDHRSTGETYAASGNPPSLSHFVRPRGSAVDSDRVRDVVL